MTREEKLARLRELEGGGAPTPETSMSREEKEDRLKELKGTPDSASWINRTRALGQGAMLGWSDEIGAALAATAVKAVGAFDEDTADWRDIYRDMHTNLASERKQYQEENAGEALMLEIAGGLMTGGAGAGRVAATKVGQKVAGSAAKLLGNSKKARLIKSAGLGATEGAIAGAGAAAEGKTLEGMGKGALLGGAISPAITGTAMAGKGLIKAGSKRRVKAKLDQADGGFKPINQADDGLLGKAYGQLGRLSGKINKQNKPWLEAAEASVTDAETAAARAAGGAEDMTAEAHAKLGRELGEDMDDLNRTHDQTGNRANAGEQERKLQTSRVAQEQVDMREKDFRQKAAAIAIPHNATAEQAEQIATADTAEANRLLSELWVGKDGVGSPQAFAEVKKHSYDVDTQAIRYEMADAFEKFEPIMPYWDEINRVVTKQLKDKLGGEDGGVMSGEALMAVRNALRANGDSLSMSGSATPQGNAYNTAASYLDSFIAKNLGPDAAARYKDDLASYGNFRTYEKAAVNARGEGQQLDFTADQWMQIQGQKNFGKVAKKTAAMQDEAGEIANYKKGQKEFVEEQEIRIGEETSNATSQRNRAHANRTQGLKNATEQAKLAAKRDASVSNKVDETAQGLKKAVANKAEVNKRAPTGSLMPAGKLVNYAAIGSTVSAFFGLPWMGLAGVGLGAVSGLGSKQGQRLAAGQAQAQRRVNAALNQRAKDKAAGRPYSGEIPEKILNTIMAAMRRQAAMGQGEQ